MSKFILIRGWLDCSYEDVGPIRDIVEEHWSTALDYGLSADSATLYSTGWMFPASPINWISVVSFGADVDQRATPFLYDALVKIAKAYPDVDGVFHLDDEEGENPRKWTVCGGKVEEAGRSST